MPITAERSKGFTLVEVLVALVVMATMAVMAWRGIDAIMRSRDISQASLDRSNRLQTVLAQWEQDLRSIQDSGSVTALSFDGGSLRLTRKAPLGMQVIAWSVNNGHLYRWESPQVQTVAALQENYQRSQQSLTQESSQLTALDGVISWQMYFYRGNGWSNAASADDVTTEVSTTSTGTTSGATTTTATVRKVLPTGARMILQFDPATSGLAGPLTRQIALEPT
jgi:general secretion pathway protein J